MSRWYPPLLGLAVTAMLCTACDLTDTARLVQCDLRVDVQPEPVSPGDILHVGVRPMSEDIDTEVRVGGVTAELIGINAVSDQCSACDACRNAQGCNACQRCPTCSEACADCEPSLAIFVPSMEDGTYPITVINRFGMGSAESLSIVAASDDSEM